MSATFTCPSCGREGSIKRELPAAAKLRCPGCQSLFTPNVATEALSYEEVSSTLAMPHEAIALADVAPSLDPDPNGNVLETSGVGATFKAGAFPIPDDQPIGKRSPSPSQAGRDLSPVLDEDYVTLTSKDLPIIPPAVFLGYVRKQSCYKSLRILVSICKWTLIAYCLITIMATCILVGVELNYGLSIIYALITLAVGSTAALIGCFLAFAFQQASSLLIDVADLLIEQGRRQR